MTIAENRDLTIYWPSSIRKRISTLLRSGRCKLPHTPRRCGAGAIVYLADENGTVQARFVLREIVGNTNIRGSVLIARKGTVRKPRGSDHRSVPVNTHGKFAVKYLLPGTTSAEYKVFGGPGGQGNSGEGALGNPGILPLLAFDVSRRLSQPERQLVQAYTEWIDRPIFDHRRLPQPGLYTDLFVSPVYTLVEAKAKTNRETLRTALGQLFDYQRYFVRHPSLAVLLPKKPGNDMLDLFAQKRITVIWRSRGKTFADSDGGRLTKALRKD